MKYVLLGSLALFAFTSAQAATSGLSPSALKLKIYKVGISTDALCTNPVTIFESATPVYTDFLGGPTLGSGSVPDGTYKCVIIEFEDVIKPTPAVSSSGGTNSCVAGVEFTLDVCHSGNSSTLIDGTSVSCSAGADHVAMYLSTESTSTNGGGGSNPFAAPTSASDATHGLNLASPLVVAGNMTSTFVVNGTGQIQENGASCECQPPVFSFR
jgi:hypothetical protein